MVFVPSWLRPGAMTLLLPLLALGSGCHKSTSTNVPNVTIKGVVTYTRIPVLTAADGTPTGLETDPEKFLKAQPARNVIVRLFTAKDEVNPDGGTTRIWSQTAPSLTDSTGNYSIQVAKDTVCFLQLEGAHQIPPPPAGTGATSVQLVADPAGASSSLGMGERPIYALRKGIDGTAATPNVPMPVGTIQGDVTVDFKVGLSDPWMTSLPQWWNVHAPNVLPTPEWIPAGSRILAILDDCYGVSYAYGAPTPGSCLSLFYRPGVTDPRGSFVEYDRQAYPLSYMSGEQYFFGSIRGGTALDPSADDAFHRGVTYPLLLRSYLVGGSGKTIGQTATGRPGTYLSPDLALLDGLGDGMAAVLLQTPFLTQAGPNGTVLWRDVRNLDDLAPAQIGPYSARVMGALGWKLHLLANRIALPGTPTTWATANGTFADPFFGIIQTYDANLAYPVDIPSVFTQIGRLHEATPAGALVDLNAVLPDSVLTPLLAAYNIPWPRPTTGTYSTFITDWGTDPNSRTLALPSVTFDMTNAGRVPMLVNGQLQNLFPDTGAGQVRFARFLLDKDILYRVRAEGVPAGATLEVFMSGGSTGSRTLSFPGSDPTLSFEVSRVGNATDASLQYQFVRLRLSSRDFAIPPTTVTLHLDQVATRTVQ
jgi:hypothetical protein